MTSDVWKDKTLTEICDLLGLGRAADLQKALKKNRKTIDRLIHYDHEQEPVLLLEELARVLDARAKALGLVVRAVDLRAAWRLGEKLKDSGEKPAGPFNLASDDAFDENGRPG